jgi:hypothetical protein
MIVGVVADDFTGVTDTGSTSTSSSADESLTYKKVTWRLLPFLMICYVVAHLGRVNGGFAKM